MKRWVVDTNVAIVANGRPDPPEERSPAISCRMAAVDFLRELLESGVILLDLAGDIQREYRTYLNATGQPGVGDQFYRQVLLSMPERVERIELPKRADGEYRHLPQSLIDAGFDRSDRKFAAMARAQAAPVCHATDRGWVQHAAALAREGIKVRSLCGTDRAKWFAA